MFSLFGKSAPKTIDQVWQTRAVAIKGVATEALQVIAGGGQVVVICWFDDRRRQLEDFFVANQVPYGTLDSATTGDRRIWLLPGSAVRSSLAQLTALSPAKAGGVTIFFDGHYPLLAPETAVLEALAGCKAVKPEFRVCCSLEDPLFQHFVGDKLAPLLKQLGLGPEEKLEHGMITRAIANAREKLSAQVSREVTAPEETVWYSRNAPH